MAIQFQCELITWGEVYRLSALLARQVKDAGYRPDVVIAIARGGYIPARLVCDFLDIYDLSSIRISHYTAGSSKEERASLSSPLCMDITGFKVLLVDDITDTGDTVEVALQHIREFGPAEIKVAVLQHKKQSMLQPDFYAKKLVKWRWIIYPWAVMEDLRSFLGAMDPPPASAGEFARRLREQHGIDVDRSLLDDVLGLSAG